MNKQYLIQNSVVLSLAICASIAVIYTNTSWFSQIKKQASLERERCYGIVKAGKNDCANGKHACEGKALDNNNPHEWIMLPKGLCEKISGSKVNG